ncbi:MAG: RNA 2'-phosphotransferase [Desulfobacteraceae bacterium]|nr:RNA 2'-phosphotransferase [Desulfobacteraceae bacterium]
MAHPKDPKQLAKLLDYILGRKPWEFGLVPDANGWVKVKDLLKSLHEEEGWRHVRRAALDEVLLVVKDPPVEIEDNRIRARERANLGLPEPADAVPKLLFTCVRQRAHPHVVEKGLHPSGEDWVVLSSETDTALRIGGRIDREPVMLTVQTAAAEAMDVVFYAAGGGVYLADRLPVGSFTAPPLPKEPAVPSKSKKPEAPEKPKTPGSFFMDLEKELAGAAHGKRRKEKEWKKQRRQQRKSSRRR